MDNIYDGTTMTLFKACRAGDLNMVKLFTQLMPEVHPWALTCAAKEGNIEVVRYLMSCGVKPDELTVPYAARAGHLNVVHCLTH